MVFSASEEAYDGRSPCSKHSCGGSLGCPTGLRGHPGCPVATIATLGQHEGQSVTLRGWLYNLRESGKLLFPIFRDGTGTVQGVAHVKSVPAEVFEALKGLTQESSVIVTGKVRADKRAPGGYELDVEDIEVVQRVPESRPLPDHAQGAWRRLPDGAPAPVGALAAPVRHSAHSGRDHARGGGVLRSERLHPHRSADSDAGGLRRNFDAVSGGLLRRSGVS